MSCLPLESKGGCGSSSRARCLLYILSFQKRILSKMRSARVLLGQHTVFLPRNRRLGILLLASKVQVMEVLSACVHRNTFILASDQRFIGDLRPMNRLQSIIPGGRIHSFYFLALNLGHTTCAIQVSHISHSIPKSLHSFFLVLWALDSPIAYWQLGSVHFFKNISRAKDCLL